MSISFFFCLHIMRKIMKKKKKHSNPKKSSHKKGIKKQSKNK